MSQSVSMLIKTLEAIASNTREPGTRELCKRTLDLYRKTKAAEDQVIADAVRRNAYLLTEKKAANG